MTVQFAYAEEILKGLVKLDQFDLPLGLFSRIRRVLKNFRDEVGMYMDKKDAYLKKYCTLSEDKTMWQFPKDGEPNSEEFYKLWNELLIQDVIFPYEPIDYLAIIDATPEEIKKKITVLGKDFNILDLLNETYNHQFNKKEVASQETPRQGETIDAAIRPQANA